MYLLMFHLILPMLALCSFLSLLLCSPTQVERYGPYTDRIRPYTVKIRPYRSNWVYKTVFCTQVEQAGWFRGISKISWNQYSGEQFQWPDLFGFARHWQKLVKTGSRIRLPDSCVEFLAFSAGVRPETASFQRVFAGNSRNTASKIIQLGIEWTQLDNGVVL